MKKALFDKEYRTTISQDFKSRRRCRPHKTQDYADDIGHNYALTAEEHYYNIRFTLNGNQFNKL
jgi:hypothetical protein